MTKYASCDTNDPPRKTIVDQRPSEKSVSITGSWQLRRQNHEQNLASVARNYSNRVFLAPDQAIVAKSYTSSLIQ